MDCSGSHSGSEEAGPIMTLRKRPRDPAELAKFEALIASNPDMARFVKSPVFTSDEQVKALTPILEKAGEKKVTVALPVDVVTARGLEERLRLRRVPRNPCRAPARQPRVRGSELLQEDERGGELCGRDRHLSRRHRHHPRDRRSRSGVLAKLVSRARAEHPVPPRPPTVAYHQNCR